MVTHSQFKHPSRQPEDKECITFNYLATRSRSKKRGREHQRNSWIRLGHSFFKNRRPERITMFSLLRTLACSEFDTKFLHPNVSICEATRCRRPASPGHACQAKLSYQEALPLTFRVQRLQRCRTTLYFPRPRATEFVAETRTSSAVFGRVSFMS